MFGCDKYGRLPAITCPDGRIIILPVLLALLNVRV